MLTYEDIEFTTDSPVTKAQYSYIESLVARKLEPEQMPSVVACIPALTKAKASKWIDKLKGMPDIEGHAPYQGRSFAMINPENKKWVLSTPYGQIPEGHYALPTPAISHPGHANETTFYFIWVGENENAWAVFLEHGPDQTKLSRSTVNPILQAIAQNPMEYLEAYGKLIGRCGICGLRLTNDESRARGIGPICAGNWGY